MGRVFVQQPSWVALVMAVSPIGILCWAWTGTRLGTLAGMLFFGGLSAMMLLCYGIFGLPQTLAVLPFLVHARRRLRAGP